VQAKKLTLSMAMLLCSPILLGGTVARANFNDRADRRQRNLGEYMLNNPSVPK